MAPGIPTLTTDRVILRPLSAADFPAGVARRIGEAIVDRIELRGKPADVWAIDRSSWFASR